MKFRQLLIYAGLIFTIAITSCNTNISNLDNNFISTVPQTAKPIIAQPYTITENFEAGKKGNIQPGK